MLSSFDENCARVSAWAAAKGIHDSGSAFSQAEKTREELDELFEALHMCNQEEIDDALGDILVTLVNVAHFTGSDLNKCFGAVISVIEKRSGKMVNGQFQKDSDN